MDATVPTVVDGSNGNLQMFCHGLKICMYFWYISEIRLCEDTKKMPQS